MSAPAGPLPALECLWGCTHRDKPCQQRRPWARQQGCHQCQPGQERPLVLTQQGRPESCCWPKPSCSWSSPSGSEIRADQYCCPSTWLWTHRAASHSTAVLPRPHHPPGDQVQAESRTLGAQDLSRSTSSPCHPLWGWEQRWHVTFLNNALM